MTSSGYDCSRRPINSASSSRRTKINSSSKRSSEQYLYLISRGRRSGLPREIEIWFTEREGRFFVIAEYSTSKWVENIRSNPAVQVRVAGAQFAASARILSPETEPLLVIAVQNLSKEKYGWGDGLVVELLPSTRSEGP
ncbi:MAG: hypothetical protein DMG68_08160 [Acidobacteria bacterium]|nr:MAG: hypothetical protein DMG68_08160 [Acidobacteriota bacterium]